MNSTHTGRLTRTIPLLLSLFTTACTSNETGKETQKDRNTVSERPVVVEIAGLGRGAVERRLEFVGEVAAAETVEVAAKLSGRIRAVKVRMGDTVKKGELLVSIEDSELRAQLKEARALLAVSEAAIRQAEILEQNAAAETARKETLIEKDLVTRQEMDNVRSRQASESAALALARAEASKSEARIQLLATQLKDAKIRAPFSGRVSARHLDPGAVVTPGTAILRLIDADPVIARFKVPERYLGTLLRPDGEAFEVAVRLEAFPDRTFPGEVARISPALDKATRSAVVEAEVPNPDGRIAPGMYCRVALDLGRRERALLLPAAALLEDSGGPGGGAGTPTEGRVYIVDKGRAHQKRVVLGAKSDGHYELLDGLTETATVVVEGKRLLKEGAKVTVIRKEKQEDGKDAAREK